MYPPADVQTTENLGGPGESSAPCPSDAGLLPHRAFYAAFDRFPSHKGAAAHIHRFARTLFEFMDGGLLYVLGDEDLPPYQREDRVEIVRYCRAVPNFLHRTLGFGRRLASMLDSLGEPLQICHFRDPWSGMPILSRPHQYATVYEVNGLPSIELPYLYNSIAPATLSKIWALEEFCLARADRVITPSHTIQRALEGMGVPAGKITVIPNGADIPAPVSRSPEAPEEYILYFGALQPWQGVDTLLRAFTLLTDLDELRLVICASSASRQWRGYRKLAEKLGLEERIIWRSGLDEEELAPWRQHAAVSVAPLTDCSRNVAQGCAPLKILESMASGTPVVASDLPCVREIMSDEEHGRLVHPERPGELARAIRLLLQYPERRRMMGVRARHRIEEGLTWTHATDRLTELYGEMIN